MLKDININIICNEKINHKRLKYTIDFIDNHPLKPVGISFSYNKSEDASINIFYTLQKQGEYHIPSQLLFFANKEVDLTNVFTNEYSFKNTTIYSVENHIIKNKQFIENSSFNFDVLETIFYHISRFEEVYCPSNQLDTHERMAMEHQILYKNKLHHTPVIDNLVLAFYKSLGLDVKNIKTTFSLTHDIDIIRKYNSFYKSIKSIGKAIQMGLGIKGVKNVIKSIVESKNNKSADPYCTYDWLFSSKNVFKNKTVYFVTGGKNKYDLYNSSYLKELPDIISQALDNSYNIGFHPSYMAYNNDKIFEKEYRIINNLIIGNIENIRMHYLRLDIQKTFELFENYNLNFDSTLGYANEIGFRCGTGFEYFPYNFKEERAWKFKEIPLVLMDSALLFGVCNENIECFEKKIKVFLEKNKNNTHITFNFHNTTFDNSLETRKGLKKVYLNHFSITPSISPIN